MTQTNQEFNPFDPTGMLKGMRDANMEPGQIDGRLG